jgi:hypothetical protein
VSIGQRHWRAAIYHYVDIGTDGRSDPAYVKQESDDSDGNWWCSIDAADGDEVIRGGKPEYRKRWKLGFDFYGTPITNDAKGMVVLFVTTDEIFIVNNITPRITIAGRREWQLKVELMHESFQTATYSDGYYYAD